MIFIKFYKIQGSTLEFEEFSVSTFRPFDRGGKKVNTNHKFKYFLKSKGTTLDFIKFYKNQRVLPLIFIEFDKSQRVLPLNFKNLVFRPFDLSTFRPGG